MTESDGAKIPVTEEKSTITLNVLPGQEIVDVRRKASQMAILEGKPVSFVFNDKSIQVTPEGAKALLNPDNLRGEIGSLTQQVSTRWDRYQKGLGALNSEIEFAGKAYPDEFSPPKSDNAEIPAMEEKSSTALEVAPGEEIGDLKDKAAKLAFQGGKSVTFTFNGRDITVTPEEARAKLTPVSVRQRIESLITETGFLWGNYKEAVSRVQSEIEFAGKAYPDEFPK